MDFGPQSTSGVNKSSGLPRPTRLPLPSNKSSRIPLSRLPIQCDPSRPADVASSVQKKPSIPTFAQSRHALVAKPLASKANGSTQMPKPERNSLSTTATGSRPVSRRSQRQTPIVPASSMLDQADEETSDQLSSLDSFRAASRQGIYDDVPIQYPDYVEAPERSSPPKPRKQSRPSLSDRTIESIQNLPATPKDRRRSSFFSQLESPMGPPPRPASSLSRNGSNGDSRPGTSDGISTKSLARPTIRAPQSAKTVPRSSMGGFSLTSSTSTRRSLAGAFHAEAQSSKSSALRIAPSTSPAKRVSTTNRSAAVVRGSKTISASPTKARPSLSDAFGPAVRGNLERQKSLTTKAAQNSSLPDKGSSIDSNSSKTSSAALREQIAAAKAAARKDRTKHDSPRSTCTFQDNTYALDTHIDPFNVAPKDGKHVLRNRINAARTDGKLNIAAMGLKEIPDEVLKMYDSASMEESRVNWAEVVDLIKFIAADNLIEQLPATAFPDKSFEDFDLDDDAEGNQFAGLEMLDLHRNLISSLPIGMRQLQRLSSLNLSHNKLDNTALDIISQIPTLKDLKLGHNSLSGSIPSIICQLSRLETLDLRSNRLLSLPEAMRELVSLKVLNVSENQLTVLPMESIRDLRLIDLDASNNALIASLFPMGGLSSHPTLQSLNIANNSLAALTFDEAVDFPNLHTLDVSCNNLTSLPNVSGWASLVTLLANDNKIGDLPVGFTSLPKIRNVNLTSNEFKSLDPGLGRMESLESLVLASNPLRERKFLTMSTTDIKRNLKARLEPEDGVDASVVESESTTFESNEKTSSPGWTLKADGSLDLSSAGSTDSINDELADFLTANAVRRLHLQANKLTTVPPALVMGHNLRLLDLSRNTFATQYFTTDLVLPSLEELNLSQCNITTLAPLTAHLQAPKLKLLDVNANRLTGALPILRVTYPALTSFQASDNRIRSITAESLRGLHVVNLASNDIESLPAEVGLLWNQGLRNFEVGRNAFRVPSYRILEKGTEATMKWLRSKLPASEGVESIERDAN